MKVEFSGLPPDADSHRLHKQLSALPYDDGTTIARSATKCQYGSMDGLATGKAEAQFRNVPDGDKVMASLKEAQGKGVFGKGVTVRLKFANLLEPKTKKGQGTHGAGGAPTGHKPSQASVRV